MSESFAFADFVLDCDARTVTYRGAPVKLTAKSVAVLTLLARAAPATVSRAEFEAAIWPEGFIEPANLTQTIYMIRKALAQHDGIAVLETLNARGYRFAIPVRSVESPAAAVDELATRRAAAGTGSQRGVLARVATAFALAIGAVYATISVAAGAAHLP